MSLDVEPTSSMELRRRGLGDRGISMIWIAFSIFFLMSAATIAIDISGGFNVAQTDQNTADLACLAGVQELPESTTNAINMSVAYTVANWPEMAGQTLAINGSTGVYTDGNGNTVTIDANYNGDPEMMLVTISEAAQTYFGKLLGAESITVTQEAACGKEDYQDGTGLLPLGAVGGEFDGDLFDCLQKIQGNCGALRPDDNGANAYRDAVADGIIGNFIKHHGSEGSTDPETGYTTIECNNDPCNVTETETGNMVGPWEQGLTARFADIDGADCVIVGTPSFNCDSLEHMLGEPPTPLGDEFGYEADDEPDWWVPSMFGSYLAAVNAVHPDAEHYYYNGQTLKCDSPRLATIPIVDFDLDWTIGFPNTPWQNGNKDMKMIGFYTVYINDPIHPDDIGDAADSDILWFGPQTTCDDETPFKPFGWDEPIDLSPILVASAG